VLPVIDSSSQNVFDNAVEALKIGAFDDAVAHLATIHQCHPTWAAWYSLALSSVGEQTAARTVATTALSRGFKAAPTLWAIADRLENRPCPALTGIEGWREFEHPWDALTARELGHIAARECRVADALEYFSYAWRSLRSHGSNWLLAGVGYIYADTLRVAGDYVSAAGVVANSLKYAPPVRVPTLLYTRAIALIELGAFGEALKDVQALAALNTPHASVLHAYVAGRHCQWSQPAVAANHFAKLLTHPDAEFRHYATAHHALCLAAMGQPAQLPALVALRGVDMRVLVAHHLMWEGMMDRLRDHPQPKSFDAAAGILTELGHHGFAQYCQALQHQLPRANAFYALVEPSRFTQQDAHLPHLLIEPSRVQLDGQSIHFPRTRAYGMLHALARHPLGLTRDELRHVVAPDASRDSARAQIKVCRDAIRNTLAGINVQFCGERYTLSTTGYLLSVA
jgi:tetratricopeptide (TPR) repeat protein